MGAVIIDSLDGIVFLNGTAFGFLGVDHLRAFGFVDFDFGFFLHVVEFLHFHAPWLMVDCPEKRALSIILTSNLKNTIPEIKIFSEKKAEFPFFSLGKPVLCPKKSFFPGFRELQHAITVFARRVEPERIAVQFIFDRTGFFHQFRFESVQFFRQSDDLAGNRFVEIDIHDQVFALPVQVIPLLRVEILPICHAVKGSPGLDDLNFTAVQCMGISLMGFIQEQGGCGVFGVFFRSRAAFQQGIAADKTDIRQTLAVLQILDETFRDALLCSLCSW